MATSFSDVYSSIDDRSIPLRFCCAVATIPDMDEESLETPGILEQVLRRSGLTEVRGQVKTYQKSETALEFVDVRSSMVTSRIMAHRLGPEAWLRFRNRVLERLSNLGEPLTYSITVNLSTGCKA